MDIARLMTHIEEVEGKNMKIIKAREFKKARFKGGFSKSGGRIAKPQHRQGNNAPNPRFNKERVPNAQLLPPCAKCGRRHNGDCLAGMNVYYRCGKPGHHLRDCRVRDPNPEGQGAPKGKVAPNAQGGQAQVKGGQAQARGGQAPRNNRFYALHGRQEVEETPDVVTGMLKVFNFDLYALLDLGANVSFVYPYVAMKFSIDPKILLEPYFVYNPVGE